MSKEELLEEIKRHIDYTNAMGEKSLRDLQLENLYNLLQQQENIIKEVREYIEKNIEYTEQKLDIDNMKTYNCALIEIQNILDKGE